VVLSATGERYHVEKLREVGRTARATASGGSDEVEENYWWRRKKET